MSIARYNFSKIEVFHFQPWKIIKIWSDCFSEYLAQGDVVSIKSLYHEVWEILFLLSFRSYFCFFMDAGRNGVC